MKTTKEPALKLPPDMAYRLRKSKEAVLREMLDALSKEIELLKKKVKSLEDSIFLLGYQK